MSFASVHGLFLRMPVCPGLIVVDATSLAPDAATIDRIARQQLEARRRGRRLRLRGASVELERLIQLAGLAEVLRVEPRR
jgi:anti-anti-sigma regulatory factor